MWMWVTRAPGRQENRFGSDAYVNERVAACEFVDNSPPSTYLIHASTISLSEIRRCRRLQPKKGGNSNSAQGVRNRETECRGWWSWIRRIQNCKFQVQGPAIRTDIPFNHDFATTCSLNAQNTRLLYIAAITELRVSFGFLFGV